MCKFQQNQSLSAQHHSHAFYKRPASPDRKRWSGFDASHSSTSMYFHWTGTLLPNPFSGFLLFMSLANTSLVRQPLLLCNCRDFSFWVIAWNTENVNTMIQPLTGVNYPHFALLKREFLISKYCFFFFSFASSVCGLSHLRFSWGQSNFWHHTDGHHLDRKSSGNQSWYLCGMLQAYG